MRIGIVTGEYPPMEGGVGDFTYHISQNLTKQGHEVHILTSQGDPETENTKEATIYRLTRDWGWASHSQITRWMEEVKPDVLNIQYQAAAYQVRGGICLFPRWQRRNISIPIITTYHDLQPPYLFPKAGAMRDWAVCQMAQYSNGVIVTNDEDYTLLTKHLTGKTPSPQIRLIHIGSNIAPNPPTGYQRDAWRAEHGVKKDELLLGFFGFLNRSKGVETLLKATAALIQNGLPARLVFIGGRTGSSDITNLAYADEIDAFIEKLGISEQVDRTGFSTPAEVSAALLATDICALPYRDGASLRRGTLHACLAHGCSIVTTYPEHMSPKLERQQAMHMVPPKDSDALAKAILDLWEKPDLRKKMGEEAATLATEFSWDRIAALTGDFFTTLANK